jgi:tight adherence protein C
MNIAEVLVLLIGVSAAGGAFLLVRQLQPAAPDLGRSLARLHPTGTAAPVNRRAGAGLIPVPRAALAILGKSESQYVRTLLMMAALGLVTPNLIGFVLLIEGVHLPFVIPAFISLATAFIFALYTYRDVVTDAKRAQVDFRRSVAIFLDLIAIERNAGHATVAALERAARVSETWVFIRIQAALREAAMRMRPPWEELQQLAAEIQVPALAEVGSIMETSGIHGAQVHETLRARAQALREYDKTEAIKRAKAITAVMDVPSAIMLGLLTALLLYSLLAGLNT